MKVQILDIEGKKIRERETKLFEEPIREDIISKVVLAERIKQPYSTKFMAGMDRSASGNIRHSRRLWKSDRGKGLTRVPRKIFWRRGTQFSWEAAIISSARGGRRAHPPKGIYKLKKINKKELKKALLSSLTYITDINELKKKYYSLENKEINNNLPFVVEGKILELKTKDFLNSLKKILNDFYDVAIQKKTIRAGIGKMRGRKYKKNAGLLFVIGNNENNKISGIEIIRVKDLSVGDLASNGARLTMFSEEAINELESLLDDSKKYKKSEIRKIDNSSNYQKEKNLNINNKIMKSIKNA